VWRSINRLCGGLQTTFDVEEVELHCDPKMTSSTSNDVVLITWRKNVRLQPAGNDQTRVICLPLENHYSIKRHLFALIHRKNSEIEMVLAGKFPPQPAKTSVIGVEIQITLKVQEPLASSSVKTS